jgi:hypothetical protein
VEEGRRWLGRRERRKREREGVVGRRMRRASGKGSRIVERQRGRNGRGQATFPNTKRARTTWLISHRSLSRKRRWSERKRKSIPKTDEIRLDLEQTVLRSADGSDVVDAAFGGSGKVCDHIVDERPKDHRDGEERRSDLRENERKEGRIREIRFRMRICELEKRGGRAGKKGSGTNEIHR